MLLTNSIKETSAKDISFKRKNVRISFTKLLRKKNNIRGACRIAANENNKRTHRHFLTTLLSKNAPIDYKEKYLYLLYLFWIEG